MFWLLLNRNQDITLSETTDLCSYGKEIVAGIAGISTRIQKKKRIWW